MHTVFGKDWYYRLFLAFGHISKEMIQCVERVCWLKKTEAECDADLASPQGKPSRLSKRGQAKLRGEALPPVEGINHQRSIPFSARVHARAEAVELKEAEEEQWRIWRAGKIWTRLDQSSFEVERSRVDRLWAAAERLSYDSEFAFRDRHGVWQNVGRKEPVVAMVVRMFLEKFGKKIKQIHG